MILDTWTWTVVYDDGTKLAESETEGWQSLALDRIRQISFYHFYILIPDNAEPVFFRRFRSVLKFDTNEQTRQLMAVCLGWKTETNQSLMWLHAEGMVVMTVHDIDEVLSTES